MHGQDAIPRSAHASRIRYRKQDFAPQMGLWQTGDGKRRYLGQVIVGQFFYDIPQGLTGKTRPMFYSRETFFLNSGCELAVLNPCRCGIAVVYAQADDSRRFARGW